MNKDLDTSSITTKKSLEDSLIQIVKRVLGGKEELQIGYYKSFYIRGIKTLLIDRKKIGVVLKNSIFVDLDFPVKSYIIEKQYEKDNKLFLNLSGWEIEVSESSLRVNGKLILEHTPIIAISTIEELEALGGPFIRKSKKVLQNKSKQLTLLLERGKEISSTIEKEINPSERSKLYSLLKGIEKKRHALLDSLEALNNSKKTASKVDSRPIRAISLNNATILFGRNQQQNSKLYRASRKNQNNLFLHVYGFSGSTVIIKGIKPTEETLYLAGFLACLYSKAWDAGLEYSEVSYTPIRDVIETSIPAQYNILSHKTITIQLRSYFQEEEPYFTFDKTKESKLLISSGGLKKEVYLKKLEKLLNPKSLELLPSRFTLGLLN